MKHSVTLDKDKCKGCTTCVKACPTEAIRVRNGKAMIIDDRCIDCGICIRVCPHHAKKASSDSLDMLKQFKYNVALPDPAFYGQFRNLDDLNFILHGLLKLGFDDVYEVTRAAEMFSDLSRKLMNDEAMQGLKMPRISSSCPTAVRLIAMRFPELIPNVIPRIAPLEYAGILARREAIAKTGFESSDIGLFYISPCPAQVTRVHSPIGIGERIVDGALSIKEVYVKILGLMQDIDVPEKLSKSGVVGLGWAYSGGQSSAMLDKHVLAVDGIENVIQTLEDVEDGKIPEADFIEVNACVLGCLGGCLNVENPFAARLRMKQIMKKLPFYCNEFDMQDAEKVKWTRELEYLPVGQFDSDRAAAIRKLSEAKDLNIKLPGLDCGSCGAPSCRALAEDIVSGMASEEDCIFRVIQRMRYLTGNGDADDFLPPPFRKPK